MMEIQNLVELLRTNELLIADIYRECEKLFPAFKDDFAVFVREEEAHAELFTKITEDFKAGNSQWQKGKVSLITIEIVQKQLKEVLAEIRSGKVAPRYAITALRSFEQGMSERSIEKLITTDSEVFKQATAEINKGFVTHLTRLQELEIKIFPRGDKERIFEI
ncbi:MAG: hypothetical protein EOM80_11490 [Erysipelotrichia bacterium]|nr:hypothetical protein [Erysipelotrichia bacterium]